MPVARRRRARRRHRRLWTTRLRRRRRRRGPADAAAPPDAAINAGFGEPIALGLGGSDPWLARDGLELWFDQPAPYELWSARRGALAEAFAAPVLATTLNSAGAETDPSLSADGLELVFVSDRDGAERLYQAARASAAADFAAAPIVMRGLEATPVHAAAWAGADTLYLTDDAGGLARATRAARGAPFAPPTSVGAPAVGWPTVSAGELELFAEAFPDGAGTIVWATRAQAGDAFVRRGVLDFAPPCADGALADPQLTDDDHTLVLRCGGDIYVARR
ncbi:MAG: hypothetical protein R2939_09780 [Kofleriaceae bacterium]